MRNRDIISTLTPGRDRLYQTSIGDRYHRAPHSHSKPPGRRTQSTTDRLFKAPRGIPRIGRGQTNCRIRSTSVPRVSIRFARVRKRAVPAFIYIINHMMQYEICRFRSSHNDTETDVYEPLDRAVRINRIYVGYIR